MKIRCDNVKQMSFQQQQQHQPQQQQQQQQQPKQTRYSPIGDERQFFSASKFFCYLKKDKAAFSVLRIEV